MPTAQVGGIDLHYELAGQGPRLLFIGGTGGDLRHRPNVFDGPLASSFEVLAYDQRGLGRSGKPTPPYSMAEYGEDAARLLDAVGWETARVVGVSFGGMVAQELALRHPERVERLVLACTSSGGAGGASAPLHEYADLPPRERALRQIAIGDLGCDETWQRDNAAAVETLIEGILARQLPDDDHEGIAGARGQLDARRWHDTWDRLPNLDVPTLVCGGRRDGIAPPPNLEALASRIPGARLEFFDGGHLFLLQDPKAFGAIVDFLS